MLLVEDDLRLSELVRSYLQSNGFRVSVEYRGDRVVERVQQRKRRTCIVLDLGLPGQNGFAVCKELRAVSRVPILILTARNSDIDHVLGLELGADDFVIKPVEPRVLVARINALLRRSKAGPSAVEIRKLGFGALSIDTAARSVAAERPGRRAVEQRVRSAGVPGHSRGRDPVPRNALPALCRREYDGIDRTLDVRISHLRRKLGDTGEPERIRTVWGHGYLFVPDAW